MPSTVVHLAVGAVVAAALLGDEFDRRSVAVVLAATAIPDIDTFAGLYLQGAHRALLHTLVLPAVAGAVLTYDTRVRTASRLHARWGPRGVRVAWVALAALLLGGILPDLMTNGVNAFYPLYDRFLTVDGELLLSNQRGVVQTFVDLSADPERTTQNTHYWTGVDPSPGAEPENVERIFPVVRSGFQLLVVVLGAFTLGARFWEER
ncbi:metal-dependent hydrolase [Haloplanus aerogenes]|uniref:LexA-binding, inner membrane-associated putative hydrolase n=1 Tax=Haloplanus aerogenes TaxID=660522 RepID=A0A3M0DG64_9EURY|nr:metal-dependent hydrolase [Haloplanus aerogenes]AZH26484.1 metal-dependent hydrolase [Haloplanus aerogenes]RMB18046.1 LexA-binding, inner membrane-associated putative hydrolase [Haloplanus aerogenes]